MKKDSPPQRENGVDRRPGRVLFVAGTIVTYGDRNKEDKGARLSTAKYGSGCRHLCQERRRQRPRSCSSPKLLKKELVTIEPVKLYCRRQWRAGIGLHLETTKIMKRPMPVGEFKMEYCCVWDEPRICGPA